MNKSQTVARQFEEGDGMNYIESMDKLLGMIQELKRIQSTFFDAHKGDLQVEVWDELQEACGALECARQSLLAYALAHVPEASDGHSVASDVEE